VDLIRSMRQYVVELGLAREHELDQLFAEALEHLDDPHTIVMPSLNFLVSGRKRQRSKFRCQARGGCGTDASNPRRLPRQTTALLSVPVTGHSLVHVEGTKLAQLTCGTACRRSCNSR
jgi:hypothetical protein